MITINGITFRNLEEQVAYLSENLPYFTIEGSELVITKEDGTEIARINLSGVASINVSTSDDITTITQTFNDGTSSSFTIDMTSYLKKVSTTTTLIQAYAKSTSGNQEMVDIDSQASNGTLAVRTSTGRINATDPIYDGNVATKKYVDDSVAGVNAKRYMHYVKAHFLDSCSIDVYAIIGVETNSSSALLPTALKDYFANKGYPYEPGMYVLNNARYICWSDDNTIWHKPEYSCFVIYDYSGDGFCIQDIDSGNTLTLVSVVGDTVKEI